MMNFSGSAQLKHCPSVTWRGVQGRLQSGQPMPRPKFELDTTEYKHTVLPLHQTARLSAQRIACLFVSHCPKHFLSCVAIHEDVFKTKINSLLFLSAPSVDGNSRLSASLVNPVSPLRDLNWSQES